MADRLESRSAGITLRLLRVKQDHTEGKISCEQAELLEQCLEYEVLYEKATQVKNASLGESQFLQQKIHQTFLFTMDSGDATEKEYNAKRSGIFEIPRIKIPKLVIHPNDIVLLEYHLPLSTKKATGIVINNDAQSQSLQDMCHRRGVLEDIPFDDPVLDDPSYYATHAVRVLREDKTFSAMAPNYSDLGIYYIRKIGFARDYWDLVQSDSIRNTLMKLCGKELQEEAREWYNSGAEKGDYLFLREIPPLAIRVEDDDSDHHGIISDSSDSVYSQDSGPDLPQFMQCHRDCATFEGTQSQVTATEQTETQSAGLIRATGTLKDRINNGKAKSPRSWKYHPQIPDGPSIPF